MIYKRIATSYIEKEFSLKTNSVAFKPIHHKDIVHYEILRDALKTVINLGADQAYVRGSLSRGDNDRHSDVDLLCVVDQSKYEDFIKALQQTMKLKHNSLFNGWHDKIVKNFGGTGFVFLINKNNKLYQLDVYVACTGNPSMKKLFDLTEKQLIFAKFDKHPLKFDPLKFHKTLEKYEKKDNNIDHLFVELCLLSFMLKKSINRNDIFLGAAEFMMWKNSLVKLVRSKLDPKHIEYGCYHVNKLKAKHPEVVQQLEEIFKMQLNFENLMKAQGFAQKFFQEHYPKEYKFLEKKINEFNLKLGDNT